MRVLICGGGVVGASIAYFLSCRGVAATVIERTGLACAASGKAGGFLALDWCDGTPLEALAHRSFALHARLAAEIGGDWGYRGLTTYGGCAGLGPPRNVHRVDWLSASVAVNQQLGSTETTAQVHPERFTAGVMRAAQVHGAELRQGQVTGVLRRKGGTAVAGVEIDGEVVEGDAVVIALGPWSMLASQWLPIPAVFWLKGHSLVFETGAKVPAEALFLECREASGAVQTPELFSASRRHHLCLRNRERKPAADRPGPGHSRPGCARSSAGDVQRIVAGARHREDPGAAGLLSSDHP